MFPNTMVGHPKDKHSHSKREKLEGKKKKSIRWYVIPKPGKTNSIRSWGLRKILFGLMPCFPDPLGWWSCLYSSARWGCTPKALLFATPTTRTTLHSHGTHTHASTYSRMHPLPSLKPRRQPWWSLNHLCGHSSFFSKNSTYLQLYSSTVQSCRI